MNLFKKEKMIDLDKVGPSWLHLTESRLIANPPKSLPDGNLHIIHHKLSDEETIHEVYNGTEGIYRLIESNGQEKVFGHWETSLDVLANDYEVDVSKINLRTVDKIDLNDFTKRSIKLNTQYIDFVNAPIEFKRGVDVIITNSDNFQTIKAMDNTWTRVVSDNGTFSMWYIDMPPMTRHFPNIPDKDLFKMYGSNNFWAQPTLGEAIIEHEAMTRIHNEKIKFNNTQENNMNVTNEQINDINEQIEVLKQTVEDLKKEKTMWVPSGESIGKYISLDGKKMYPIECIGKDTLHQYSHTKENALKKHKRTVLNNKIASFVEEWEMNNLSDGGKSTVFFGKASKEYKVDSDLPQDIGTVTMSQECAIELCKLLNNGTFIEEEYLS